MENRGGLGDWSRRALIKSIATAGFRPALAGFSSFQGAGPGTSTRPQQPTPQQALAPSDEQLLDELERANFLFFWEQASPQTGLVKDRCNVRANDTGTVASIAATGFGLTALCIGHSRGLVPLTEARERVIKRCAFSLKRCPSIAAFSTIGPTSIPANGCGTRRSLRWTRQF